VALTVLGGVSVAVFTGLLTAYTTTDDSIGSLLTTVNSRTWRNCDPS
jgi:hypothetical protein